jgi:hypothetical protein
MNAVPDATIYVTSLREILWGIILVATTMIIHGFGMILTLRVNNAFKPRLEQTPSFALGVVALILASWMIILVHLSEVAVWAGFFLWKGALPNYSLAYYFTLNEYTTVGSDFNLPQRWRLLEGMVATAGLLGFAWSTGVLVTLAQDFQRHELQLLKQRREKRQPKPTDLASGV